MYRWVEDGCVVWDRRVGQDQEVSLSFCLVCMPHCSRHKFFVVALCAKECIRKGRTSVCAKLVRHLFRPLWHQEWHQSLYVRNRITPLWVPGHSGVQGYENVDTLAREGSGRLFWISDHQLQPNPVLLASRLKRGWRKCTLMYVVWGILICLGASWPRTGNSVS